MIIIEHLFKNFGTKQVLNDVNLRIADGETVCVIGPSGSGKSTLLRCINGLESPTKGMVSVDNTVVNNGHKTIKHIRQKVGMVFQDFCLFERKKVIDNITLAPTLLKLKSKADARTEAMQLLKFVGLSDKANEYPHTLSGGEKQRIAIARAMAMHPQYLLMDEPTSALDPELVQEVLQIIRLLSSKKITLIIVTNQLEFAKETADRIVFMENGTIVEEGTPIQLFESPKNDRTKEFISKVFRSI